jgi:DNA-directed RNA polymerase subunit E"
VKVKACRECRTITTDSVCPKCKTALSDDFSGLAIVIDAEGSQIAKVMKITENGRYALRVR